MMTGWSRKKESKLGIPFSNTIHQLDNGAVRVHPYIHANRGVAVDDSSADTVQSAARDLIARTLSGWGVEVVPSVNGGEDLDQSNRSLLQKTLSVVGLEITVVEKDESLKDENQISEVTKV